MEAPWLLNQAAITNYYNYNYNTTNQFTPAEHRLWPKLVRALRESVSRYSCVLCALKPAL
jgi:hypothetical protein